MNIPTLRRPGESPLAGEPPPPAPSPSPAVADRAERAAANERYQSLLAQGEARGSPHCGETDPDHDFDHCGTEYVPRPVLFTQQHGDVQSVDPQDVRQRTMGDCYFMATLSSLASSPSGRALIQSAITENRNDQGAVVSYAVTLHRPETHWLGLGRTTFAEVRITVDGAFAVGHGVARPDGGQNEIWPLVLEKAYAMVHGGYDAIGHGGVPSDAMQALTGREATRTELRGLLGFHTYGAPDLLRDLAAGKMVVLGTWPNVQGYGLDGRHSYAVTGTRMQDGKLCVTLHNPWIHADDPTPVPVDELESYFHAVDVGTVN